jgi:hypothetical protein
MNRALSKEEWLEWTDEVSSFSLRIKHKNGKLKRFVSILLSDGVEVWQADEIAVVVELWDVDIEPGSEIEIIDALFLPLLLPVLEDPDL